MKKNLLLLPFLILSFVAVGQRSFSPIGTTYYYESKGDMSQLATTESIVSEKDTLIGQFQYRKLLINGAAKNYMEPERTYKGMTLVRESNDSIFINGRLTYYLGAKENDTTVISGGSRNNYLILDSIRYKEYFAAMRKVYYFRQKEMDCYYTRQVTFVENYGPIDAYLGLSIMNECYITNIADLEYSCGTFEGTPFRMGRCEPLSANDLTILEGFKIFPNPAGAVINLQLHHSISLLEIFNSFGTKVFETLADNNEFKTIDISNLPAGVYHLQVNGNFHRPIRFVKR